MVHLRPGGGDGVRIVCSWASWLPVRGADQWSAVTRHQSPRNEVEAPFPSAMYRIRFITAITRSRIIRRLSVRLDTPLQSGSSKQTFRPTLFVTDANKRIRHRFCSSFSVALYSSCVSNTGMTVWSCWGIWLAVESVDCQTYCIFRFLNCLCYSLSI